MLNLDISEHEIAFKNYVASERLKAVDPAPMDLKLEHTFQVLSNARSIVAKENFAPRVSRACILAALYHDVARFEQYLRFNTFKDRDSINHGQLGAEILEQSSWLSSETDWINKAVVQAVRLHNQFALPEDLPSEEETVVKVVRDADKLDILRVMDGHLNAGKPYNPTVVLSLPDDPNLCNPVVISQALEDKVASYGDLKSVNDFCLLLATWINDLNFASSREEFVKQQHALHILNKLPETGPYAQAKSYMISKLSLNN